LKQTSDHWLFNTVDGRDECLKGVRKQLRLGAEIIKFHASGGVLSELDDPINQQFSLQEAQAIVEEATRAQVAVAAHCHGAPGIKNALMAGVKSIEHGTYLDDELADLMIEKNAILVPTRFIIEESLKLREILPDYAKEKMDRTANRHWNALKLAIKKGVTIAMGTDIAGSATAPINKWGDNAKELEYYVNAGMTEMQAIVTATGNGPKTLGPRAPRSGMLKEGYDADILLLKKNPLEDIKILQNQENIINVIKKGKRTK
ncbi:MAG: amidohydrolase family protein, partial [Methanobacteriota archaeon]